MEGVGDAETLRLTVAVMEMEGSTPGDSVAVEVDVMVCDGLPVEDEEPLDVSVGEDVFVAVWVGRLLGVADADCSSMDGS